MTLIFDLHRRAGALERLLNRCRRKGWTIDALAMSRHLDDPDLDVVRVTFDSGLPATDHVIATLARCLDVVAIAPEAASARARVA